MKVSSNDILSAARAIVNIAQRCEFPALTSYRIAMMKREIVPIAEELEKQQLDLCKKYGEFIKGDGNGRGDTWKVEGEAKASFDYEWIPIAEEEVEINVKALSVTDLGSAPLLPMEIDMLGPFLAPPEENGTS